MADIYEVKRCAHVGQAWQGICQRWADWLPHEDYTIALGVTSYSSGSVNFVMATATVTTPSDTYHYWYPMMDTIETSGHGRHNVNYVASCQGWNSAPPLVNATYGARDTLTEWSTHLHPYRATLLVGVTSCTVINGWSEYGDGDNGTYVVRVGINLVSSGFGAMVDVDVIQIANYTTRPQTVGDQCIVNAWPTGPAQVVVSAGGGVDVAPIVAAINELAMVDNNVSVNNGAAMWSVRGKVRTS